MLKNDNRPKVIDLFSGAGGLSLGAEKASFSLISSVEIDKYAVDTHKNNFPKSIHISKDIAKLSGEELLSDSKLLKGELDGIIGGPPCQGFSTMGHQNQNDMRNDLFLHYFRLVDEIKPKFFLVENVPGILNLKYDNLRNKAFSKITNNYKLVGPMKIVASLYGAPTTRKRIFVIGIRNDQNLNISENDFKPDRSIKTVNVETALFGLPNDISTELKSEIKYFKISNTNSNEYIDSLRNDIPENVGNIEAIEMLQKNMVTGIIGTQHSEEVRNRYFNLKPGEQDPISKSIKLIPHGFCPTLRAGTDNTRGSYQAVRPIHYANPRVICPREAARLQGFPDWFVFQPTKWHSFRQIGNSVSPVVANHILKIINNHLFK